MPNINSNPFSSLNFYAISLNEELELLNEFHKQQEEQINSFIANINDYVSAETEERYFQNYPDDPGEVIEVPISHIGSISEDSYDIKEVFSEVMPMYQRQAMLISVWALLENELAKCIRFAINAFGKKLPPPKRKPRGESDFSFLIKQLKAIDLINSKDNVDIEHAISKLNNEVRHLRNTWVHHGGVVRSNCLQFIEKQESLSILYGQLNISKSYINTVYDYVFAITNHIEQRAKNLEVNNQT